MIHKGYMNKFEQLDQPTWVWIVYVEPFWHGFCCSVCLQLCVLHHEQPAEQHSLYNYCSYFSVLVCYYPNTAIISQSQNTPSPSSAYTNCLALAGYDTPLTGPPCHSTYLETSRAENTLWLLSGPPWIKNKGAWWGLNTEMERGRKGYWRERGSWIEVQWWQ